MPRKSTVKQLPPGVVKAINDHLEKEKLTLDDLVGWLEEKGYEISRSSLGRYKKSFDEERRFLRETRSIAETFARELGEDTVSGEQGQLLIEMMHGLTMRYARQQVRALGEAGEDADLAMGTKELMQLARTIMDTQKANRLNQDFVKKLREEIVREVRERAAAAVDSAVADARQRGERGFTKATVDGIKARILGVDAPRQAEGGA